MSFSHCVTWQSLENNHHIKWVDNFIKCRSLEDAKTTVDRLRMKQETIKDIKLWGKV